MANMLKSCGFFLFYALRLVETCTAMSERFMNKPTAKTISLRLPTHLLDAIKAAANARDVPYQSLIKVWLQEKLHV